MGGSLNELVYVLILAAVSQASYLHQVTSFTFSVFPTMYLPPPQQDPHGERQVVDFFLFLLLNSLKKFFLNQTT